MKILIGTSVTAEWKKTKKTNMNPPDPRSGNATIINMKWQIHVGVSEGIQPWNQGNATGRAHMARISPNAFLNLYHPI